MQRTFIPGALLVLMGVLDLVSVPACGDTTSGVDCSAVCESQQSCFEVGLSRPGCWARCDDLTAGDHAFRSEINACGDCIAQRDSCSEVTDRCDELCEPVRGRLSLASSRVATLR